MTTAPFSRGQWFITRRSTIIIVVLTKMIMVTNHSWPIRLQVLNGPCPDTAQ